MIKQIEIEGYRLLDGFKADLRPLTVVIGANAVGKSTLLDCLQCIAQCAEFPLNTAIGWHWGMNSLLSAVKGERKMSWHITFSKPVAPFWKDLPLDDRQAYVYEVILKGDIQGRASAEYEVLRNLEPVSGKAMPLKYLEANLNRRYIFNRTEHKLVPFDDVVSATPQKTGVSEEPASYAETGLPPAVQEPALMLSQIRFFNEFPVPSFARVLLANMAFYPGFDVTKSSFLRRQPAEIKPQTILAQNGEDLGTVLHEILTRYDYRQTANDIREFLQAAYPAFEEIHCDTTHGTPAQVLVRVREKQMLRSMEIGELSDGMLRFLCLACALLNPVPPPFIAVDEPEIGLHPRLFPIIADMIKTASERTQVLITTHSPDLLNQFDIEDVAVMSRGEELKTAWHRPADRKTLVEMLKDVEAETLGDLHRSGELEAMG